MQTVAYNGALVTFHRESRPDPVTSAGGIVQSDRLQTVDVELSGQRVRAYALAYATSATTERSLLSSVTVYGKDTVLDGNGAVVSGTSLPPTSYTYRDDPQYAQFDWDGVLWNQDWCHTGSPVYDLATTFQAPATVNIRGRPLANDNAHPYPEMFIELEEKAPP